jgi:hypothetical protein
MDHDQLKPQLELLQQELAQARADGDDEELARLEAEAQALIDGAPAPEAHASLRRRLDEALPRFEASHPTLTLAISQVIDTLNRMGL